MNKKSTRRSHSAEFKQTVCAEIRSGRLGRREAQRTYRLSDNLLQTWLARFDANSKPQRSRPLFPLARTTTRSSCKDRIAVLERKLSELATVLERSPRIRD